MSKIEEYRLKDYFINKYNVEQDFYNDKITSKKALYLINKNINLIKELKISPLDIKTLMDNKKINNTVKEEEEEEEYYN